MLTSSPRASALAAYDAFVAQGISPRHEARVREMQAAFQQRAGVFGPDDPWFESRSRAFWDHAVTQASFVGAVGGELAPEHTAWGSPFVRAHRGLFRSHTEDDAMVLEDVWGGAEFIVTDVEPTMRRALESGECLVDGRLVAASAEAPLSIALLPGALFHPPEATEAVSVVLMAARAQPLDTHTVLDALMRMELQFASLSRMKASFAYRPDALSSANIHVRPR
jgi:hypothetical protein